MASENQPARSGEMNALLGSKRSEENRPDSGYFADTPVSEEFRRRCIQAIQKAAVRLIQDQDVSLQFAIDMEDKIFYTARSKKVYGELMLEMLQGTPVNGHGTQIGRHVPQLSEFLLGDPTSLHPLAAEELQHRKQISDAMPEASRFRPKPRHLTRAASEGEDRVSPLELSQTRNSHRNANHQVLPQSSDGHARASASTRQSSLSERMEPPAHSHPSSVVPSEAGQRPGTSSQPQPRWGSATSFDSALQPNAPASSSTSSRRSSVASVTSTVRGGRGFCLLCRTTEYCVLFLPCGHLACCQACSEPLDACVVCLRLIGKKMKVFLA